MESIAPNRQINQPYKIARTPRTVPPVDSSLLTSVLMGMLGLGAMRTVEKTKSVARDK